MRRFVCAAATLAIALALPAAAQTQARAENFARWTDGAFTGLAFEFAERGGDRRRIAFALRTTAVDAALNGFARFDPVAVDEEYRNAFRLRMEREIENLRARFPGANVSMDAGGTVHYAVDADLDAGEIYQQVVNLMRGEAATLRRDYPALDVVVTNDGTISVSGPMDPPTERAIDRRLNAVTASAERLQRARFDEASDGVDREMRDLERNVERALIAARARAEMAAEAAIADQNYAELRENAVFPDYKRIARAGADQLADALPAFQELVRGLDERSAINRLLAFFQSIPYDPLTSRSSGGNGAGFALPVALLARNRGDCDTKSVAFASVLHRLFPRIPIGMVLLDDHALIALGVPPRVTDETFSAEGREWVLAEPVGPGLARLGQIGVQTRAQIQNDPKLLRFF